MTTLRGGFSNATALQNLVLQIPHSVAARLLGTSGQVHLGMLWPRYQFYMWTNQNNYEERVVNEDGDDTMDGTTNLPGGKSGSGGGGATLPGGRNQ